MHPIIDVLWFMMPAYIANSVAVDVSGIPFLKKYSTPMDFGRSLQGKRIFGDGKTWRGFLSGVVAGLLFGALQQGLMVKYSWNLPGMGITLAFLLSLGTMVGDLAASFIKRRMGFERGKSLPLLDQLDFVFGAFYLAWLVIPVNLSFFIASLTITIPLHYFGNFVAWLIKLKKFPW